MGFIHSLAGVAAAAVVSIHLLKRDPRNRSTVLLYWKALAVAIVLWMLLASGEKAPWAVVGLAFPLVQVTAWWFASMVVAWSPRHPDPAAAYSVLHFILGVSFVAALLGLLVNPFMRGYPW